MAAGNLHYFFTAIGVTVDAKWYVPDPIVKYARSPTGRRKMTPGASAIGLPLSVTLGIATAGK